LDFPATGISDLKTPRLAQVKQPRAEAEFSAC